ncbi:MAG: FG-GAP-like repeat-containing protein [Thermoanaerobaculia bacterium]|nr:FG-GAP-like repeat-containing protein [Thermoanaerobaculia bacterium]
MAWILTGIGLVGAIAGVWLYRSSRPEIRRPGEDLPEITSKLERKGAEDAPRPRFREVTEGAGLSDFVSFVGDRSSQLPEDMGSGAAWGDYDRDGDEDLFLVSSGGSLEIPREEWGRSRLYENLGDGSFAPDESFPELRIAGMGAAWGDYDHDGWLDLAVTGYRALHLFHNEEGNLVEDRILPEIDGYWSGVSWADFDNDRDLDLYVCGYVRYEEDVTGARRVTEQYGAAVPFTLNPASYEAERNLLFQNRGDGTFEEVALLYGVANPEGRSLGALWHDFDQDGRLDLYVANDISDNALYLNRGETFEESGLSSLVADYRGAMGLAAGDWNRDGDDDLFITHWVAQENALYDSRLRDLGGPKPGLRLMFTDLSAPLGLGQIALQMVGWGTEFADLDSDGWLDLVVVNGSTLETDSEPKGLKPQPPFLFWNRRGESFHDLAPENPALSEAHVGRGLAVADHDRDGDLDLLMMHLGEGAALYRNEMEQGNRLRLKLRSRDPDGDPTLAGEGATVIVRLGERELRRSVTGASYLSQSSRTLHFGLGDAQEAEVVEVRWLGAEAETWGPLKANSLWELTEGEPAPRRLPGGSEPTREEIRAFWEAQRAGMDLLKREGDCDQAIEHFREALALDPGHEDSRYYLANCLAATGQPDEALEELGRLRRQNPRSHRAQRQWAVLRALHARSSDDLEAAEAAGRRALAINREETGSVLVLGELALIREDRNEASRLLEAATRTNPKAACGFFLRAYLAETGGSRGESERLLERAREARGEEWKPEGAVAEGDVARKMHREQTPLADACRSWGGDPDPDAAFVDLREHLAKLRRLP